MDIFVSVLLPLAIAFMMFSLGVGLTLEDFKRVGRSPRAFWIAMILQVILLPVLAYVLIIVFGFTAETAVGVMILAACPGGVTSNIVTRLAHWDLALSVSLTAIVSLTCMVTAPLILEIALHNFMGSVAPDIDITETAFAMFLLSSMPILSGIALRYFAPQATALIEPVLTKIAVVLFVGVIGAAILSNWNLIAENASQLWWALLSLVILLTVVGYALPTALGCSTKEAKTISIETGVQNGSLGIGISAIVVGGGDELSLYAIPSAVYSVIYLVTVLPGLLIIGAFKHAR